MEKEHFVLAILLLVIVGVTFSLFTRYAAAPTQEELLSDSNSNLQTMALTLTSPAFVQNEMIPLRYTCDGENSIPPLDIGGVPEGADSLVLVMDDPDIPMEVKDMRGIEKFDHWVVYNVSPETKRIEAGTEFAGVGLNSAGKVGYTGPCPPPEYEPPEHRYVFRLYAIKGQLEFTQTPTLDEVEQAAQAVAIEKAELMGRYRR